MTCSRRSRCPSAFARLHNRLPVLRRDGSAFAPARTNSPGFGGNRSGFARRCFPPPGFQLQ